MITLKTGDVVPCGKCPACLANMRQEWVFRLKQEYLASEFAIFVTLTYDDEHVPVGMNVCKKDVQNFHKRLRKHFPPGDLRFYVVSEYGDHTHRPHYHGLYFFKSDYNKDFIYSTFEKSWKNGFLKFGEVEEGSIVYCTKYCLKHSQTPEGRTPTFRLVSKMNGGLGINYLEKMGDFHAQNMEFSFVYSSGKRCRMPRYYATKLSQRDDVCPSELQAYKLQRLEAIHLKILEQREREFKEFCSTHKGMSFSELVTLFNEQKQKSYNARDELILKHCKKQKL